MLVLDFATPAVFQCTSDVLSCKLLIPCFLVCLHQSLKHVYFEIPDNNALFVLSTKLKARFNIILQLEILVIRLLQRELLKSIFTSRHDFSWNYCFSQRLVHWLGLMVDSQNFTPSSCLRFLSYFGPCDLNTVFRSPVYAETWEALTAAVQASWERFILVYCSVLTHYSFSMCVTFKTFTPNNQDLIVQQVRKGTVLQNKCQKT